MRALWGLGGKRGPRVVGGWHLILYVPSGLSSCLAGEEGEGKEGEEGARKKRERKREGEELCCLALTKGQGPGQAWIRVPVTSKLPAFSMRKQA